MNGLSDQQELTSGCAGGGVVAHCGGIAQPDWEFTRITAGF